VYDKTFTKAELGRLRLTTKDETTSALIGIILDLTDEVDKLKEVANRANEVAVDSRRRIDRMPEIKAANL
jgi:hypothetical protein